MSGGIYHDFYGNELHGDGREVYEPPIERGNSMQSTEGKPERVSAEQYWREFRKKNPPAFQDWYPPKCVYEFAEAYAQSGDGTMALLKEIYDDTDTRDSIITMSPEVFNRLAAAVKAGAVSPEQGKPPQRFDEYAAYANHCAIQKTIPVTWHTWKRGASAPQSAAAEPKGEVHQLAKEIASLAHLAWTDPKNAQRLFLGIENRATRIICIEEGNK